MVRLIALGLLGVSASLVAAETLLIDSMSPLIIYDPPQYGTLVQPDPADPGDKWWAPNQDPSAWNTTFTTAPWRQWDPANITNAHYTWAKATPTKSPTARLSFVGTGIVLKGPQSKTGLSRGNAKMEVEGTESPCQATTDDLVTRCAISGLKLGRHDLTLTVEEGTFYIDHFEIDTGESKTKAPQVLEVSPKKDSLNTGSYGMEMSGAWTTEDTTKDGDGNPVYTWNRAVSTASNQWIKVDVPKNSRRVEVWGAVDIDHSAFKVDLTPDAYGIGEFSGSAYDSWTTQNMSMYGAVLDPAQKYTIKVTNMADTYLDISQIKFYEDDSSGSALSAGAIAGIVIGCVAGVLLIGLLIWWLVRRRRNKAAQEEERLDIDDDNIVYSPVPPESRMMSIASYHPSEGRSVTTAGLAGLGVPYHPHAPSNSNGSSQSGPVSPVAHFNTGPLMVYNPDSTVSAASVDAASVAGSSASPVPVKGAAVRQPQYHHMQHTDGGGIPAPSSGVIVTEAPPVYDPDWTTSSVSASGANTTPSDFSGPIVTNASEDHLASRSP